MPSSIPVADLEVFFADPASREALAECRKVAESFINTGALIIRDPRATTATNDRFLDLLEAYFSQPRASLEQDLRPEVGYQVGVTLENTEKPVCGRKSSCLDVIRSLKVEDRPLDIRGHESDPKQRFFWKLQGQESKSNGQSVGKHALHEAANVIPNAFEEVWAETMDGWGGKMRQAVEGVSRMLAVGLGLSAETYVEASRNGSHLLAPTATDLAKYGSLDSIFAGFHQDLNFISCHGRSRYPGLHIWARNTGSKIQVKVPEGCLLLQAGMQLEWVTGGLIKAGYHEVVCSEATLAAIERTREEHPERPLIRISSTFFYHLSPDHLLAADTKLAAEAQKRFGPQEDYGELTVADQVKRELGLIALLAS